MPVDSSVELCALYGHEVTLGSGVVSYKALGMSAHCLCSVIFY